MPCCQCLSGILPDAQSEELNASQWEHVGQVEIRSDERFWVGSFFGGSPPKMTNITVDMLVLLLVRNLTSSPVWYPLIHCCKYSNTIMRCEIVRHCKAHVSSWWWCAKMVHLPDYHVLERAFGNCWTSVMKCQWSRFEQSAASQYNLLQGSVRRRLTWCDCSKDWQFSMSNGSSCCCLNHHFYIFVHIMNHKW